jgi:hypothetical protein
MILPPRALPAELAGPVPGLHAGARRRHLASAQQCHRQPAAAAQPGRVVGRDLTGAFWGLATILFNPELFPDDGDVFYRQALFGALLASQCIAAMACYSAHFPSFLAFLACTLLPGLAHVLLNASILSAMPPSAWVPAFIVPHHQRPSHQPHHALVLAAARQQ